MRNNEQPYYRVQIKASDRNLAGLNNERIDIQPGMTTNGGEQDG